MANVYINKPIIDKSTYLSVIVTFYNQERFVDKCLQSIFEQQTQYSFEIVIVDDGSVDNTINIVEKWVRTYPNLIRLLKVEDDNDRSDQIRRVSRCRLLGLSASKGKYLCFLDGDDFFASTFKFEKQVSMLEKNIRCCACLSNYMSTFDGADIKKKCQSLPPVFKTRLYVEKHYVPSATMIYRNVSFSCYDDNFDDNSISFSLFATSLLCFVDEITFCHYKTKDSSWLNKNKNQKNVAILKNIDDSLHFSRLNKLSIFIRHCSFICGLYSSVKNNINYDVCADRQFHSFILKKIINYNHVSFFDRLIVKLFVHFLILIAKIKKVG